MANQTDKNSFTDFGSYLAIQRAENSKRHSFVAFISETLLVVITSFFLWSKFDSNQVLMWAGISILISIAAIKIRRLDLDSANHHTLRIWKIGNTVISFFIGACWGLVPLVFFEPNDSFYLILVCSVYAGYISGSLSVTFSFPARFTAFITGITLPFLVRLIIQGDSLHLSIAGLMVFYVTSLIFVSRSLGHLFERSTRTQFDNTKLVENLRKEKDRAEKAIDSKNQFLAAASHDLRQPLNAISLLANAETRDNHELLSSNNQTIRTLSHELGYMLNGLIDLSQLRSGTIKNRPDHINLKELVQNCSTGFVKEADNKGLSFHLNLADITVYADPFLLKRIINNLLDNAIKYTPKGSISVVSETAQETAVIRIRDSGVGIPTEMHDKVFDEFFQIDNPERDRSKGFGLGLATVKMMAQLIQAGVSFNSNTQDGTEFELRLPLGDPSKERPKSEEAKGLHDSLSDLLVFVVDDDKDNLLSMKSLLESWGISARGFENCKQIESELSQGNEKPDLIVSDLRLKGNKSGVDIICLIREAFLEDIPAIVVTGDTDPDRVELALKANTEVLYKPVDTRQLYRITQRLVDKQMSKGY